MARESGSAVGDTAAEPATTEASGLGGLVKHSAIYSLAPIVRQLISIGMHRLYTGWLGTAGFGVKEIADLWLIALQQLLGQNVLGAMVRFYYEQRSEADRRATVTSCTLLVTLAAWAVCGSALAFSDVLTPLMLGRGEVIRGDELLVILELTLLLIPFQLASLSGFYYLQILKRSGLYTGIQTGKLLFEVVLNFVLIGALDLGVRGFLLSMLAGEALTSLGFCVWMFWRLGARIEWRILRPILVYAAPLIPVGICQLALHHVDRRLLILFGPDGLAQSMTGIYGHGYKIGYLVTNMVLGPFVQIWHPWIFGVHEEGERARLVARVSTYAVLAIAVASLGVILLGRQAAVVLAGDAAFWEAYRVIPFIASGYVFWALYHVSQLPLLIAKRTGRLFLVNLVALVLNVAFNLFLIPRLGFVGAGVATLLTFACLACMGVIVGHSQASVPFELARLAKILAGVLVGGFVALWIDRLEDAERLGLLAAIAVKCAVFAVLAALLWFGVLGREERRRFREWVASRRGRSAQPR